MKSLKIILFSFILTQFLGCHLLSAARIVTTQGNIISEKQLQHLKIGMNKNEVAILLGSSLITPTFTNNRWDYSMTWQKGEGPLIIKRVTLYFTNDRLSEIKTGAFS
jgi:outer membrane protein assembly factor BamE